MDVREFLTVYKSLHNKLAKVNSTCSENVDSLKYSVRKWDKLISSIGSTNEFFNSLKNKTIQKRLKIISKIHETLETIENRLHDVDLWDTIVEKFKPTDKVQVKYLEDWKNAMRDFFYEYYNFRNKLNLFCEFDRSPGMNEIPSFQSLFDVDDYKFWPFVQKIYSDEDLKLSLNKLKNRFESLEKLYRSHEGIQGIGYSIINLSDSERYDYIAEIYNSLYKNIPLQYSPDDIENEYNKIYHHNPRIGILHPKNPKTLYGNPKLPEVKWGIKFRNVNSFFEEYICKIINLHNSLYGIVVEGNAGAITLDNKIKRNEEIIIKHDTKIKRLRIRELEDKPKITLKVESLDNIFPKMEKDLLTLYQKEIISLHKTKPVFLNIKYAIVLFDLWNYVYGISNYDGKKNEIISKNVLVKKGETMEAIKPPTIAAARTWLSRRGKKEKVKKYDQIKDKLIKILPHLNKQ